MANRTQVLVLGFAALMCITLGAILALAPEVYAEALRLAPDDHPAKLGFLGAIFCLIVVIGIGVLRRWRWMFWLLMMAFLGGVLRLPASILELNGMLPRAGPSWYVLLQAVVGLAQFAIGLLMLAGYRRAGVWGEF